MHCDIGDTRAEDTITTPHCPSCEGICGIPIPQQKWYHVESHLPVLHFRPPLTIENQSPVPVLSDPHSSWRASLQSLVSVLRWQSLSYRPRISCGKSPLASVPKLCLAVWLSANGKPWSLIDTLNYHINTSTLICAASTFLKEMGVARK